MILQSFPVLTQHNEYFAVIRNNTVVNSFTGSSIQPSGTPSNKSEVGGPDTSECFSGANSGLNVTCSVTQGNEGVAWFADNPNVAPEEGSNRVGSFETYGASPGSSPYTADLFFASVSPVFSARYYCTSQISGTSSNFFLTPREQIEESSLSLYLFLLPLFSIIPIHPLSLSPTSVNPYIAAVSPQILNINEGDPTRLEFIVAVNSDGSTWDQEDSVGFFLVNSVGESKTQLFETFTIRSEEYPQNYVFEIPVTSRYHSGNYSARGTSKLVLSLKVITSTNQIDDVMHVANDVMVIAIHLYMCMCTSDATTESGCPVEVTVSLNIIRKDNKTT